MITITKQDNGVLFGFEDSKKYLYGNGSILVPFNTLSIIADESDMITFKKAASNDAFLSARYDTDLGYRSKDDAIDDLKDLLFAETGGGSGSGVTPSEVQEMIDESISGKADTSAVTAVDNALSAYSATTDARIAEDEEVTAAALNNLDERIGDPYQKVSGLTIEADEEEDFPFIRIEKELEDGNSNFTYINDAGLESTFDNNTEGSTYSSYIGQGSFSNSATDFPDDNVTSERSLEITTDGFRQTTYENYDDGESGYTRYSSENEFNYSNGLTLSQQLYDPENDETTNSSLNIINNGEGETYIELTDVDENSVKIETTGITINGDAVATEPYVDDALSGKVDTSAITTAITSGSTDSEIPTAKAVYDATQGGGGGATYSAGTNISIDTANTINCTLPITTGTNVLTIDSKQIKIGTQTTGQTNGFSFAMGDGVKAAQYYTFAVGASVEAKGYCSQSFGQRVYSNNHNEFSCGKFNDSVTGSTASGQTLFSVGNGENYTTNKHNALEIRQNGDIYFPDTDNTTYQNDYQKPMVRLQDVYGALGGLKFVQCSQSEYDSMVSGGTVDSSTIYFITNVVS